MSRSMTNSRPLPAAPAPWCRPDLGRCWLPVPLGAAVPDGRLLVACRTTPATIDRDSRAYETSFAPLPSSNVSTHCRTPCSIAAVAAALCSPRHRIPKLMKRGDVRGRITRIRLGFNGESHRKGATINASIDACPSRAAEEHPPSPAPTGAQSPPGRARARHGCAARRPGRPRCRHHGHDRQGGRRFDRMALRLLPEPRIDLRRDRARAASTRSRRSPRRCTTPDPTTTGARCSGAVIEALFVFYQVGAGLSRPVVLPVPERRDDRGQPRARPGRRHGRLPTPQPARSRPRRRQSRAAPCTWSSASSTKGSISRFASIPTAIATIVDRDRDRRVAYLERYAVQ